MDKRTTDQSIDDKTRDLLESSGTWEDNRSEEEIIKEIYYSRTASQKGADYFIIANRIELWFNIF